MSKKLIYVNCFHCLFLGLYMIGVFSFVIFFAFSFGTGYGPTDNFITANCHAINSPSVVGEHLPPFPSSYIISVNVTNLADGLNKLVNVYPRYEYVPAWLINGEERECYFFQPTHFCTDEAKKNGKVYFDSDVLFRPYILLIVLSIITFCFIMITSSFYCLQIKKYRPTLIDPEQGEVRRRQAPANRPAFPPFRPPLRPNQQLNAFPPEHVTDHVLEAVTEPVSLKSTSSSEDDSENECSICLRKLFHVNKDQSLTEPSVCCQSIVHEKCFMEWLQNSDTCPSCSSKIFN